MSNTTCEELQKLSQTECLCYKYKTAVQTNKVILLPLRLNTDQNDLIHEN